MPQNQISHARGLFISSVQWIAHSPGRAFIVLFVLGFGLRLCLLSLFPRDLVPPNPEWETGAIALSLVRTGEFADPYCIPTGPTAHAPPLYVWASSLLYRLIGFNYPGGLVRWLLVFAASSALWGLLPWFGRRLGLGMEPGILGGLAGALALGFPSEIEPFIALSLGLILVTFLARWQNSDLSWRGSLLLGLAMGIAFHLSPSLLPVVLVCMVFELWWSRNPKKWGFSGLMALGIILACLPWGWRNYDTFRTVFFVRSNLGLELHVGNHEGAHADIDVSEARASFRHPRTNALEAEHVRKLGEGAYMKDKQREALQWIKDHPATFLTLTARRVVHFWAGPLRWTLPSMAYLILIWLTLLGAWRAIPALAIPHRAALFIPLATFPLIHYVVAYMPRYGEPVRWLLLLFAGEAVWGWVNRGNTCVHPNQDISHFPGARGQG